MEETEELRYLDGPKLVKWLAEEEGIRPEGLTDAQKRRWRDWVNGERADFYGAVDRVLTNHGISMRLIPDDCWAADQKKHKAKARSREEMRAVKREALVLVQQGYENKQIAQKLNVNESTIGKWKRAA
jgi:hypothetical protein